MIYSKQSSEISEEEESGMRETNHIGKRADRHRVLGRTEGGFKDVEYYTITCDECGEIGRYEEGGNIICQGCGMVLGGPVRLSTEFNSGRGWSEKGSGLPGSKQPMV